MVGSIGTAQAAEGAAVLQQVQGTVLVNQGETYTTASEGMTVKIGDQLMVMEQGSAILAYEDGCAIPVTQDAVVAVVDSSVSCNNRQAMTTRITTKYTQLGEGAGGILPIILGGTVAAAVVYEVTQNNTPSN